MYVYIESEPGLFTVGFYSPDGTWHPDSDHESREKARSRVAYLNGANVSLTECPLVAADQQDHEEQAENEYWNRA